MANLQGNEVESRNAHTSQVYDATHKGERFLPFMNRSFMSFTYGGKHIEDFNLIASIKGDRLSKDGYANFDSITTSYDVGQGQYYWGSYYKNNSLSFTLVTDGMDQRQLDDFVWWFAADQTRELILAEHPNRAIMARISSPPKISLLPFEKKIDVQIGEEIYKTSTTNYKGEIELEFVMDEPHWYSVINIFGHQDSIGDGGMYRDTWTDANGEERSVYDDPDAIKIAYEDGIPISGMLQYSMLLGDNTYATVRIEDSSCIAIMEESHATEDSYTETYLKGAVIADDENFQETYTHSVDVTYNYIYYDNSIDPPEEIAVTQIWPADITMTVGRIAGPKMSRDTSLITVGPASSTEGELYFYYAGTAPAPVKLTFTLTSAFDGNYISIPSNKFVPRAGKEYSTITIESNTKQQLCFTTPGIYTAYNAAVKIFRESINLDWPAISEKIRDFVYHSGVRAWAMKILDYLMSHSGGNIMNSNDSNNACTWMKYVFYDEENHMMPATYMFNSKNGEAIGQFRYRMVGEGMPENNNGWAEYRKENIIDSEENIGDMLKSNYLIIRDRNMPKEGVIKQWSLNDKTSSHRFYHDMDCNISNVKIEYRNMYL